MAEVVAWEYKGELYKSKAEALRNAKINKLRSLYQSSSMAHSYDGSYTTATYTDWNAMVNNSIESAGILSATELDSEWLI
jgi:hypothetical protein